MTWLPTPALQAEEQGDASIIPTSVQYSVQGPAKGGEEASKDREEELKPLLCQEHDCALNNPHAHLKLTNRARSLHTKEIHRT